MVLNGEVDTAIYPDGNVCPSTIIGLPNNVWIPSTPCSGFYQSINGHDSITSIDHHELDLLVTHVAMVFNGEVVTAISRDRNVCPVNINNRFAE